MGYLTYVSGDIAIDPPIPWGEIRDSVFLPDEYGDNHRSCIALRVQEDVVEIDEGTLTRRQAVAIVPAGEDRYKAYTIESDLQSLVDQYGAGRTFTGYLEGNGDDNGDMWRLYVRDGKAVKATVQLIWPASTPGGG